MPQLIHIPIRKLVFIAGTILIVLFFSSCRKGWFNIKSDQRTTVPDNLTDFQLLLDNFYVMTQQTPGLGEVGSDGHYVLDLIADLGVGAYEINAYTWSNQKMYNEGPDWNLPYNSIFTSNLILDGLKKIDPQTDQENFNKIKGAALFHRAKNFFDLAQLYAEPYQNSTDTKYGLPLVKTSDVTVITPRSTVHETYLSIINDLKEAENLLPVRIDMPTRASRLACWALLSRVNLVMGEYSETIRYADSVINTTNELMDFQTMVDAGNIQLGLNKEVIFYSSMITHTSIISTYTCTVEQDLIDLYQENDLRKSVFFQTGDYGPIFAGQYTGSIPNFSGLAVDEILLNRAEALANNNRLDLAQQDIIKLREHRYTRNTDGSSTYIHTNLMNKEDVLRLVYDERQMELVFRGIRWMDLRRKSIDVSYKKTLRRTFLGTTYDIEPNSYKFTLPIPLEETSRSGIFQNAGWK